MSEIQVVSGRPSAATHRVTQPSTTLNRRYVRRPANLAVEEIAREIAAREEEEVAESTPSRLVNLRVHAADLEAARMAEEEQSTQTAEEAEQVADSNMNARTIIPTVVEMGSLTPDPAVVYEQETSAAMGAEMSAKDVASVASNDNTEEAVAVEGAAEKPSEEVDTATLAMNIAADYAAASLGASIKNYGNGYEGYAMPAPEHEAVVSDVTGSSVDAIARAASEAIASIREATEPSEVSEQVASLKAFAENIKAEHAMPEMRELGDTIEKFVNIAMKSTKVQAETEQKDAAKVTLSPKVTRAAAKVTKSSAKVMAANRKQVMRSQATQAKVARMGVSAKAAPARMPARGMRNRSAMAHHSSSNELKEQAIHRALESVATMDEERGAKSRKRPALKTKRGGAKRFAIAFACAAVCVGAVLYFVSTNIPDISVKVAALQTGIEASYPSYIPRDYSLENISSEDGKITMVFAGPGGASFTLIEEKSSWDSSALLRNYVEPTWGEEYTTTHESGITVYIANGTADAAWVNGGVLYKITSSGTQLTKKQVRSIVISL